LTGPDVFEALSPVVRALERAGVDYLVGGSVASSTYGVARSTLDVDLVARLAERHVAGLAAALQGAYYLDEEAIRDAVRRHGSFNLIHLATAFKVDVFVLKAGGYDQEAFSRRRLDSLGGDDGGPTFFFATAEDVVLRKLAWYRLGGEVSERHWNDVLGVLRVQRDVLDRDYLNRWGGELKVAALLARAWAEAGAS